MRPTCVWLANLRPDHGRLLRNSIEPLGWLVRDLPAAEGLGG